VTLVREPIRTVGVIARVLARVRIVATIQIAVVACAEPPGAVEVRGAVVGPCVVVAVIGGEGPPAVVAQRIANATVAEAARRQRVLVLLVVHHERAPGAEFFCRRRKR